ncbi:MAG: SIMPL domain-containing protein [Bacteroidetes bacterium]|nr:SIMPL domain-containing protein [Bacteroidota bacterium]
MKRMLTFLLFPLLLTAQSPLRTVDVTGTGTYKTMPDLGILTVEVTVVRATVADAVKELTAKTDQLTAQLQMIGFKKDGIVTADFSVAPNIVWENSSNVEKGYIARQTVSVEFPNTKERIAAVINSFMGSRNDVRFSFQFTLSPERQTAVDTELLKHAVADARSRAEVMAAAANVRLGAVRTIAYRSASQPGLPRAAMFKTMAAESAQSGGFDVKELTLTDEVTVVWDIQ